MKIRTGFVSNSSSSSFVVFLDRVPKTVEDVIELFQLEDSITGGFSSKMAAESFLRKIEEQDGTPLPMAVEILEESHSFPEHPEYLEWEWDRIPYDKRLEKLTEYYEACKTRVREICGDKKVFAVTYSDEDGSFNSAMEHGNFFDNVEHKRVSHH